MGGEAAKYDRHQSHQPPPIINKWPGISNWDNGEISTWLDELEAIAKTTVVYQESGILMNQISFLISSQKVRDVYIYIHWAAQDRYDQNWLPVP